MPVSILGLPKTYKNLQRLQFIVNVLLKHGFGSLIDQLNLQRMVGLGRRLGRRRLRQEPVTALSMAEHLRMVMEELGPCFIKFGQILSSRPDLVPPEFIKEFKKLQEHVTPISFQMIKAQIERQFGRSLNDVFKSFEQTPCASASISQVHFAELHDGMQVVVKVQRPGISRIISSDINILLFFAQLMEKYIPESRNYRPLDIVNEFSDSINRELDFRLEGNNMERFQANFADEPGLHIPSVHWGYTGREVLTMERLTGFPVDNPAELAAHGLDPADLARRGGQYIMRMVFEHGFFHADPHPGNFFIQADGVIALLDFGMVGRLDREQKESLADLFVALLERDYGRMVEKLERMGFEIPEGSERSLRRDLQDLIEPYYGRELQQLDLGDILQRIMEVTLKQHIRFPSEYLMMTRALVIIEGVGRTLDPQLDMISLARPMAANIIQERLNPRRLAAEAYRTARDFNDFLKLLPRQLGSMLKKLNSGTLRIEFLHEGLEDLLGEIDRASNRITFGLLITGLVVGSSLVMSTEKGPSLLGYPAFGVVGYGIAGILGVWLLISILRSGRL
ncbi:AarF/ABC1/UbiB kinase family protein [bacterium]|nr:AarF/ABC1/UbiB kinase family protein [candidate division CSSED10-310 bacterium]